MIALIQRVSKAQVLVSNETVGSIDKGLLILLGIEHNDDISVVKKLAEKVIKYRVFNDENGKMNLNLIQAKGDLLVVSQFTLAADTSRGLRPSFSSAAVPDKANELYLAFIEYCQNQGVKTQSGKFGADMQVELINDGPVTFQLRASA